MSHHQRLGLLIVILVITVITMAALTTWSFYRPAQETAQQELETQVAIQARMLETIAFFAERHATSYPGGARTAALHQLQNIHGAAPTPSLPLHFPQYTAPPIPVYAHEIFVGERQQDQILFLHAHGGGQVNLALPAPLSWHSPLAEPMRLALQGHRGSHNGVDTQGRHVIFAYAPLPGLQLGIVAKIALADIRAPFIHAGLNVALVCLALIALGTFLIERTMLPMIQSLEERETRFRELVNNMSSGVAVYQAVDNGADFIITDLNRASERITRRKRERVINNRVTEAYPGVHELGLLEVLQRVYRTGQAEFYPVHRYEDHDVTVWVENYVYKLPNNEVIAVYDDVTERWRAVSQLRRYETIVAAIASPIAYINLDYTYRAVNAAYAAYFHVNEAVMLGRPMAAFLGEDCFQSEIKPNIDQCQRDKQSHGQIHRNFPCNSALQDVLDIHYYPSLDANGMVEGVVISGRDITRQHQMEQELRAYSGQLEERVLQRTRELEEANLTLQQLAKMKDEFLASVSHELRSPLNIILTSAEVLHEGIYGNLQEKQRKLLDNIHASGSHLLSLINDILDLAKAEAGKMELDPAPASPYDVCLSCVTLMKETARQKRLELAMNCPPDAPHVVMDGRRMKQILLNLLSNAVKFTPAGGHVGVDFHAGQGNASFTVWDTGIGIAPSMVDRLFQPFVQLDSRLSREYAGTGLGLALVKTLTQLHGGQVSLASEEGQGSRFTVSIPYA